MHNVRNQKFLNRLAKNLKKARKKRGMSQEDLAYKSGIALSQVARIETGKLNTSVSTVFVILQALDADANELFE
ncbi:MAG: helix-turn-helix transcriptional regulator [Bacteroidota bacterium]